MLQTGFSKWYVKLTRRNVSYIHGIYFTYPTGKRHINIKKKQQNMWGGWTKLLSVIFQTDQWWRGLEILHHFRHKASCFCHKPTLPVATVLLLKGLWLVQSYSDQLKSKSEGRFLGCNPARQLDHLPCKVNLKNGGDQSDFFVWVCG